LAQHYTKAGLDDKALSHWLTAGQRALASVAGSEAIGHLGEALLACSRLPATTERDHEELKIRLLLSSAHTIKGGWAAAEAYEVLSPAQQLAERLSDTDKLLDVISLRGLVDSQRDNFESALSAVRDMDACATRESNDTFYMYARIHEALYRNFMGEFKAAQANADAAMSVYDPSVHRDYVYRYNHEPRCGVLVWAGWWLWALGYPDQAKQAAIEQLEVSRQIGHVWNLTWALQGGAAALIWRGEHELVLQWNREAKEIAIAHGLDFVLHNAPIWGVPSSIAKGEYEAGYAEIVEAERVWRNTGALIMLTWIVSERAKALAGLGRIDEALIAIQESLDHSERTGQRIVEAEANRLKGEFLLLGTSPNPKSAEASFMKCLEVARRQEAKSYELRGAMSLARLWQSVGKREEAHGLLAPIYHWFTEGFDTRDLIEAKALLERLASRVSARVVRHVTDTVPREDP
jgi:predicted ATPase